MFLVRNFQPLGGQGRRGASPQLWSYKTTDTIPVQESIDYFKEVYALLSVEDMIASVVAGALFFLRVTSVANRTVTVISVPVGAGLGSFNEFHFIRCVGPLAFVIASTNQIGGVSFPFAANILGVGAYSEVAGVGGSNIIDINLAGSTIMTTDKITIDAGEINSETAATPPVLTTTVYPKDGIFTFDVDSVNTTTLAKGLVVWLDLLRL